MNIIHNAQYLGDGMVANVFEEDNSKVLVLVSEKKKSTIGQ